MFPTWRGQNEQGMALAAVAFAKASRRRRIMVATSSIGPGATNMVTAAAVAHANRLPVLLLAGDTFTSRIPDPVLQQVEVFGDPSITVNDAFRPVTRFWDRIVRPEQVAHSLPHAVATMLDPATCGPAFLALPQDVQGQAYDYPERLFEPTVHEVPRPRPDAGQLGACRRSALAGAERPLIIAGGGVHYSFAEAALAAFAERHNIPVVETVAGKASLLATHPLNAGPIGVTGCTSANALAAEADVVLAVGTRLQDFTTGSWTLFRDEGVRFIGLNTAGYDAVKHLALPLVADAREGLAELTAGLGGWRGSDEWAERAAAETAQYHRYIDKIASPDVTSQEERPTYAQVIGAIDRLAEPTDYAVSAAGGFPGELNNGWRAKGLNSFDSEYGYSCMGYEISGGWGAKMALPDREVIVFVGDGSYLMMNSDLYSSVLSGHKLIVVVCDNGGFAVINRLQVNQGGAPFNNLLVDSRVTEVVDVDFAAHAASMGCRAETVASIPELEAAFGRARGRRPHDGDRHPHVGARLDRGRGVLGGRRARGQRPGNRSVEARAAMDAGKSAQRVGW